MRRGPAHGWPGFPLVGPGHWGPALAQAPAIYATTPEIQRAGSPRQIARLYGIPDPWARAQTGATGFRDTFEADHKLRNPIQSPERVRWIDALRCVAVDEGEIGAAGLCVEIVRVRIPEFAIAVIERLPLRVQVEALGEDGAVVYTYPAIDGSDPCLSRIQHPDPTVAPLTWRWSLTVEGARNGVAEIQPPTLGITPSGEHLIEPWDDARFGDAPGMISAYQMKILAQGAARARLWIVLTGPASRYAVRVTGRITGHTIAAGSLGAALHDATTRH
jgi:hypothetical protein